MEAYFGRKGLLAETLPGYEERPGQIRMSEEVNRVLQHGGQLIIEAGTGIGKTLAYLIPAILSGKRVVISTGTINLQDQIFQKDIPFLQKYLGKPFRACLMKGRENYLCLRRFNSFHRSLPIREDAEEKQIRQIIDWMKKSESGDRTELPGLPDDSPVWREVNSRSELCRWKQCPVAENCFITLMKERAAESDLLIVNHHLLFADLSVKEKTPYGAVIPPYDVAILDEAHLVEDIASSYFGLTMSNHRLEELFRDTFREASLAGIPPKEFQPALERCQERTLQFFYHFKEMGDDRFRITEKLRERFRGDFEALLDSLEHLGTLVENLPQVTVAVRGCGLRCHEVREDLSFIGEMDRTDYVYWGEKRRKGAFLWASPIDVSGILRETFFPKLRSLVFTSATLTTNNNFDYFKQRMGLDETEGTIMDSPFDYPNQSAIYLPEKLPDPREEGFVESAGEEIQKILNRTQGRALILFTSHQNMEEVYSRISGTIPFRTLKQGDHPKSMLLKMFADDVHSVLFATGSFWQGVDVQGESLSCVIVDKLPFASPSDPLVGARIDWIEKSGGNPFLEYQVPSAVLLLKQGFGRLIRNKKDVGVLSILDRRIRKMGYGKIFLDSLPPSPVVSQLDDIHFPF